MALILWASVIIKHHEWLLPPVGFGNGILCGSAHIRFHQKKSQVPDPLRSQHTHSNPLPGRLIPFRIPNILFLQPHF